MQMVVNNVASQGVVTNGLVLYYDPMQTVANQSGNIITFVATSSNNWIRFG